MRYRMMVKNKEEERRPPSPELLVRINQLIEGITSSGGELLATGGLLPSAAGAKIRAGRGKLTVTDGPFTEGKELVGGYAVIRFNTKQDAIEQGRNFMQAHIDVLGPEFEGELEIREMADLEEAHRQR
jgi:hypothetical protein